MLEPIKSKQECYEVEKIFDFFDVMRWMSQNNLWDKKQIHDDMFEMLAAGFQTVSNDSYQKVYRHWIDDDRLGKLFDLIREEFHIKQDISKYDQTTDETRIVFWVSW